MGLYLNLFALSWWLTPSNWPMILMGIFGLGLVIFVHELGHFLVAKMCGVKCEKFFIGFDINGLKLWSRKWGETEYGIGVLPLGGYVKMLGQEDNPARVSEEMERAKQRPADGANPAEAPASEQPYTIDPRSYLAQSVPERMAIISAGVVMNVIFAFIFASIAYAMGVQYTPAVVGTMFPGEAAWQADLRPGDQIVQLNDIKQPRFQDLMQQVALGDLDNGVSMVIKREGVEEPISINVMPERKADGYAPRIGMSPARTLELYEKFATSPFSLAAAAKPEFKPGDVIQSVNGQPVKDYAALQAVLARQAAEPLTFTVSRKSDAKSESATLAEGQTVDITVPPAPMKWFGFEMRMGPIAAVRPNSPAAAAGLKAGDVLVSVNGEPAGDPLTLPQRTRALAGRSVKIGVKRAGQDAPVALELEPRDAPWYEESPAEGTPLAAPALGIAYRIENVIERVGDGSAAAEANIKPGDEIIAATLVPPADLKLPADFGEPASITVKLGPEAYNLPRLFTAVQEALPGTKVELTLKEGNRKVTLEPVASDEWFIASDRGLMLKPVSGMRTASSFGEALSFGKRETIDALLMVVQFLKKIGTQVSPLAMGGPITIFKQAGLSAEQGLSPLLIFLCMLSANLAVINFLPIPVLDGGHMVFLALEGIRGKPVSERVFLAFTYAGFVLILMLMVFVLGLDIVRDFL